MTSIVTIHKSDKFLIKFEKSVSEAAGLSFNFLKTACRGVIGNEIHCHSPRPSHLQVVHLLYTCPFMDHFSMRS